MKRTSEVHSRLTPNTPSARSTEPNKMSQRAEVFIATKSEALSVLWGTHTVEGENQPREVSL